MSASPHLRCDLSQLPDAVVIELAAVESDGAHQVQTRQQTPQPRPLQHLEQGATVSIEIEIEKCKN